MILERVEKDNVVDAIYESSNIIASSYDKNKKDLNITFKHGGSYTYQEVSATDYLRFETADSQGKILNGNIKKYAFLKHENVDVDTVVRKIKAIKLEEAAAMELGLIKIMKESILSYDNNGSIGADNITKLTKMLGVHVTSPSTETV